MRTKLWLTAGVLGIGLVSGSLAETPAAAPRPPGPVIDPALDTTTLTFAGADYVHGAGVFIDTASIDNSHSDKVEVRTITVRRDPGFSGQPRYERSAFAVNCAGDRPVMTRLSRTQIGRSGETLGEANRAGGTEWATPGGAGQLLRQAVCGKAPLDGNTVAGVAGAIALFDPSQVAADDIRRNGGRAAGADDPGRASYLETRRKELAATSAAEVSALIPDYERAATAGSRQAAWRLVEITQAPDLDTPHKTWLRKLADGGDARAQVELARILMDAQPCDEARTYLERSAAQNDAEAQTLLGDALARGECGPKDRDQAFVWTEKAARQGDFRAQLQLGKMYEAGVGVKASAVEAGAWYTIATGHSADDDDAGYMYFAAVGSLYRAQALSQPITAPRERARELCRLDNVCKLVVRPIF